MYVGCHRFTDRREGLHRRHDVIVDDVVRDSALSDDVALRQLVLGVALATSTSTNATLQSTSPAVGWLDGDMLAALQVSCLEIISTT